MSHAAAPRTLEVLTHHWWSLVGRGAAAILFGAAVFLTPELTLDALAVLFAGYAVLDGALTLVAGFQERTRGERWGALFLAGGAGVGAGLLTLLWSGRTVLSLLLLIGAWAVAVGVLQIVAVARLGHRRRGELLLALAGAVSALFGAVLVLSPIAGLTVLGAAIALYALGSGGLLIALGRRLRTRALRSRVPPDVAHEAAPDAQPGAQPDAEPVPDAAATAGR